MSPRVSVIITAYNAGAFIDASVGSALGQSFDDLEVIVVNDGSTDDTAQRLSAWHDPRLHVIEQTNAGYAAALNTGIRAARAGLIGILDADDVWLPGKLARHVQVHDQQPGVDVSFSWVNVIDARGAVLRMPCPRSRGTISFSQLLADYAIRTSSAVVMRKSAAELAGLFDSRLIRCIDFEFFLRVSLLRPENIHAIPEVLTLYRRHPGQRTRNWRHMEQGWKQVFDSLRPRAPEAVARVEGLATTNMYRYFAALAYEDADFADACRLLARGFAASPARFFFDRRNWLVMGASTAGRILPRNLFFRFERFAGFDRYRGSQSTN